MEKIYNPSDELDAFEFLQYMAEKMSLTDLRLLADNLVTGINQGLLEKLSYFMSCFMWLEVKAWVHKRTGEDDV